MQNRKKMALILIVLGFFFIFSKFKPFIYHIKVQQLSPPVHKTIKQGLSTLFTGAYAGLTVEAKLGNDKINSNKGIDYLLVSLKGDDMGGTSLGTKRLPLNLSIVIDRSGSMSGEKLENVKKAILQAAKLLEEGDFVSLVIYDTNVQTLYSDHFDYRKFTGIVSEIESGGSTYLEGGLREGLKNTQRVRFLNSPKYLSRVILLSDGLANVGVTSPDKLGRIVEDSVGTDIVVSTIGVGSDYDENLMTKVAIAGGGNYYFMRDAYEADEIFAEEFEGLVKTVATDIDVELDFNSGLELKRAIGYKMKSSRTFLPHDMYVGKTSNYLFEIASENITPQKSELAKIKVSFNSVKSGKREMIVVPVNVAYVGEEVNPLQDDRVYQEYMDIYLAQGLWQVDERLDKVKNFEAVSIITSLLREAEQANTRLNGVYDDEVKDIKNKQDYVQNLGDSSVKDSVSGRLFKKENQAVQYDKLYNK